MKADSVTHLHLLAVINSELSRWPDGVTIRLLDIGCGDGRLLAYLGEELVRLWPGLSLELYGVDVRDHGVQPAGFMERTVAFLARAQPERPWHERVLSIADGEAWPFPSEFFHVAVSNQVGEHVLDHAHFFGEVKRTLVRGGFSAHLFPLRHYILEGHLLLPFAHRIRNTDLSRAYIRTCSWLGLGKFSRFQKSGGVRLEDFAERHADYVHYFTNYLTQKDVMAEAKRQRLRVSFRYTQGFYTNKLRTMAGLRPVVRYRQNRWAVLDWAATLLLRYVSSVTVFLENDETYTRGLP